MKTTYRQDRQTGEIAPIDRWRAVARLTTADYDPTADLTAATRQSPLSTVGAFYWTEVGR